MAGESRTEGERLATAPEGVRKVALLIEDILESLRGGHGELVDHGGGRGN